MKHMVVVYEIEDDNADISEMLPKFPHAKSMHMTSGVKLRQVGTGEEAFIPYARWFEAESSTSWNKPEYEEYNWLFLRSQQNWANDMLRARGHIMLNEVYDSLGLSRTTLGAVVGWTYALHKEVDPSQPNFVDFGCWEQEGKSFDAKPGAILLDFNVQGPILHALG